MKELADIIARSEVTYSTADLERDMARALATPVPQWNKDMGTMPPAVTTAHFLMISGEIRKLIPPNQLREFDSVIVEAREAIYRRFKHEPNVKLALILANNYEDI